MQGSLCSLVHVKFEVTFICFPPGYIDRVRQLQQENSKLIHQVKTFESYQTREISNVKSMYDKQVEDLKAALDTMNKQYNQLKVGDEGLLQENEELKSKYVELIIYSFHGTCWDQSNDEENLLLTIFDAVAGYAHEWTNLGLISL